MPTIQNAVQAMVDKLTAAMLSETPLTSEEQMLVAKAISALQDNQTWEQAVVAVVEEHINNATTALLSAEEDINTASQSIQEQASALALLPDLEDNLNNEIAKIVPNTEAAVKQGVGAAYARGALILGARETQYAQNTAIRAPYYSNQVVEAFVVPYYDSVTKRMYVAYISTHYNNPAYHTNIHFGYWDRLKFVTIYRQNLSGTSLGEFSESGTNTKRANVYGVIVPLRKSDDPADVRMSLILCSSASSVTDDYSWRAVISVKQDGTELNIYKGATATECDSGDTASDHPLSANPQHSFYDRTRKIFIGYKGSIQCWDSAIGIASADGVTEDWVAGIHPTADIPLEELSNTDMYISFTGYRQNTLPPYGRYIRSLGDSHSTSYNSHLSRAVLPAGSGYTYVGWNTANQDQFGYIRNTVNRAISGNGASYGNTYRPSPIHAFSYLMGNTDGDTELRQIYYQPKWVKFTQGEDTSTTDLWELEALSCSVLAEDGSIIANGDLPIPERAMGDTVRAYVQLTDYLVQPVCYDELNKEMHVVRSSYEYIAATATYSTYSLIYKF